MDFSKVIKNKAINKQINIRAMERGFERTPPRVSERIPINFNKALRKGELSKKRANDTDIRAPPIIPIPIHTKS